MSGPGVSLVQAAGGDTGCKAIVAALRALGPVSAVNYPAGGAVSAVLRAAGARCRSASTRWSRRSRSSE